METTNRRVVTLGEVLMRLSPNGKSKFVQSNLLNVEFGGAEINVAILLANLGVKTSHVTKIPENSIGEMAIRFIKENGVNTEHILSGGDRLGIYFFEPGFGCRISNVIYDRKGSAMALSKCEEYEIKNIFKDAYWFHVSGITPALTEEMQELVKKCISYCKDNGIKVSVDLNYRSKLWSYKEFKTCMYDLVKGVDLCIGWLNTDKEEEEFTPVYFESEEEENVYFNRALKEFKDECGVKCIATTVRKTISTDINTLKGIIYDGDMLIKTPEYKFNILDRIGAGDAFAAGLIYGLINNKEISESLNFAVASGVYKHTVNGDACIASYDEIIKLTRGGIGGGVVR